MSSRSRGWIVCFAITGAVCGGGSPRDVLAQQSPRPILFEGEATANDVYVRSGDSANHYTVCKLNAGHRVQVLAERGEWYEILPPAEAFSLISGDYVDSSDGKRGVVNGTNVRVRAGSVLNGNKYTVQTLLGKGSEVSILGKNADGFLRIVPPAGATLWINREYVQRIPDGLRALEGETKANETGVTAPVAGSRSTALAGDSNGGTENPGETSTKPVVPRMSRSLAQLERTAQVDALAKIDAGVNTELAKPVLERRLEPFLAGYQAIAAQDEDEMAQRYAQARETQLSDMIALLGTVREMRRLEAKSASRRRGFQAERAGIRTVAPSAPSGLDAEGVLRRSALYPKGSATERFRLVDLSTPHQRTVAYVETPANSTIDVEPMIGKYVGVRASAKRWQQGGVDPVPIFVAQEVVVLETQESGDTAAEK